MAMRAIKPIDEVDEAEVETIRVDLTGAMKGFHLIIDADQMTLGFFEDIAAGNISATLAPVIVGGNLPHGNDREGLRKLKILEARAVVQGVQSILDIPKS